MARRTVITVAYEDGTEERIPLLPIHIVMAERHFGAALPKIEGSLYGAWIAKRTDVKFEDWMNSLVSIEESIEGDTGPLAPTPPPAE